MIRSRLRHVALAIGLSLTVAACGGDAEGTKSAVATSGEPIASIAPPAGKAWSEVVTKTPDGGYLMGNPDAPIKLLEFGALSCSHCADFAKESFAPLRDEFVASGRVSYELRLFMLNALDVPAALLATCGSDEAVIPLSEQFWAWQPKLFENLQAAGDQKLQAASSLPPAQQFQTIAGLSGMTEFFASRGIARDQANACLANTDRATQLAQETQKSSKEYEVTGTPTFLINGQKIDTNAWNEIRARLEALGAR